ncbi:MAG: AAA family ATPase [Proteobacteria bacterium]|nr:OLD family endonuclease [Pseudomonadota bacterium]NOG59254.1 AAA family ATPase [Pseudomonadota bacterium]
MHYISKVILKNYKSIIEEEFLLSPYTSLVGYNNAGKSNILDGIKWLVSKSSLDKSCFNNAEQEIEIIGDIEGVNEELLEQLTDNHRNSIAPYIFEQKLRIRRIQSEPSLSVRNLNIQVWNEDNQDWSNNPAGIENAIKQLFPEPIEIGAMEDSAEDVSKFKSSTTIGKLIAEVMSPIEVNHSEAITTALNGLKERFDADGQDRAEELNQFDQDATAKLQELFPGIEIKMHIPTPELKEVFKSGTIKVYENEQRRDLSAFGHGTQRSIQMALIRHLAEVQQNQQNRVSNTLLLIDEPELYLHPQAVEQVRSALKALSIIGYQVIFSTHSPQMIPSEDIKYTLLIRKHLERGTYARKRLKDAIDEVIENALTQFELLFSLENANAILFSEKVILTEGKTEKKLIPHLFSHHHSKTLGQEKLALVGQGGVDNTSKAISVLEVMDLPCKAIVDLDFAFKGAVTNGLIDAEDQNLNSCKDKFLENDEIELSDDGLPKNGGGLTPSQAYKWLAEQNDMQQAIQALHLILRKNNIWLWKKGDIEVHLGLKSKTERVWATYKQRLIDENFEQVVTDPEVVEMLNWIS